MPLRVPKERGFRTAHRRENVCGKRVRFLSRLPPICGVGARFDFGILLGSDDQQVTDALLPGDLLFFLSARRGNVNHVALYLGDGKYIEAAGADVHISSMKAGDEGYDAKRAATFGWARRVIE